MDDDTPGVTLFMPIKPSEIKWASYQNHEGPYFGGRIPYVPPQDPDFLDKCLQVLAATEGGRYDAINMYDTCVLTVGIIQVCERVYEFSRMLGACTSGLGTMRKVFSQMPAPADFRQNPQGKWRFFFLDGRGEVDSEDKMRIMFMGGSAGLKGDDPGTGKPYWSDDQKQHAREVAAAMTSLWEDPVMRDGQREYVKLRLMAYVRPQTKTILFSDPEEGGWTGALKALVISYSANIPANADKLFLKAAADPEWAAADPERRFRIAAAVMALESGIGIWPHRYEAVSQSLTALFGVNIPKLSELHPNGAGPDTSDGALGNTAAIQRFLISKGYDLGPAKDDGIFGSKTKAAISDFQKSSGIPVTGLADQTTKAAMLASPDRTP